MGFVYFSGSQSYLAQASCPVCSALILSENIPNADSVEGDGRLCLCMRVSMCARQALAVQGEQ